MTPQKQTLSETTAQKLHIAGRYTMKDHKRKHQRDRAAMPFPDLIINGHAIPIVRSVSNPLTREACERYGLEGVDNDIIHTRLHTLPLPAVSPTTSALIYYIPTKLDLSQSMVAPVGLRLNNERPEITNVQAITYEQGSYKVQYDFSLPGEIGCTATANLGFLLLRDFQGILTRRLGILTLADRDYLDQTSELDIPVADDSIMRFCRDRGSALTTIPEPDTDCPDYPECKNQSGMACNQPRAKCRRKR
jgi:hypothetical protein